MTHIGKKHLKPKASDWQQIIGFQFAGRLQPAAAATQLGELTIVAGRQVSPGIALEVLGNSRRDVVGRQASSRNLLRASFWNIWLCSIPARI